MTSRNSACTRRGRKSRTPVDALIIALLVIVAGLLATVLLRQARAARSVTEDIRRVAIAGRRKLLVEAAEGIRPGTPRARVLRLLGAPDRRLGRDWAYELDRQSGYLIEFDGDERVRNVAVWIG